MSKYCYYDALVGCKLKTGMDALNLQLVTFNVGEFLPGPETDIARLIRNPTPGVYLRVGRGHSELYLSFCGKIEVYGHSSHYFFLNELYLSMLGLSY